MKHLFFVPLLAIPLFVPAAQATPIVIQPNEANSKDTLLYEFLPTFNFDSGPFGALLGGGKTGIGHDFRTLIQFDLAGVSVAPGERATLNLYVGSTSDAGFGNDPTPATPVAHDVFAVTAPWSEGTVTWGTQPSGSASAIGSATIDSISHYVSFDITAQVQGWLANPSTNNGMIVVQRDIVGGGQTAAVYNSSAGVNAPFLEVAPVPEPSTIAIAAIAIGKLTTRRRRRD